VRDDDFKHTTRVKLLTIFDNARNDKVACVRRIPILDLRDGVHEPVWFGAVTVVYHVT
jgi:hypothetical protein